MINVKHVSVWYLGQIKIPTCKSATWLLASSSMCSSLRRCWSLQSCCLCSHTRTTCTGIMHSGPAAPCRCCVASICLPWSRAVGSCRHRHVLSIGSFPLSFKVWHASEVSLPVSSRDDDSSLEEPSAQRGTTGSFWSLRLLYNGVEDQTCYCPAETKPHRGTNKALSSQYLLLAALRTDFELKFQAMFFSADAPESSTTSSVTTSA